MAKKKLKTKDFKTLQELWDKKLARSGFVDIEDRSERLKMASSVQFNPNDNRRGQNTTYWASKEAYYHMANQFLYNHDFKDNKERIIWEYHANGLSVRDIVTLLKKARIKTYRTGVWMIISRLEDLMKRLYLFGYDTKQ